MNLERFKYLPGGHCTSIYLGIILILGIISYSNSLNVPMQFDDVLVVRISSHISSDLYSIQSFLSNPRWLTDITFAINRHLHGVNVLGYHLINLAIHLSSACVIYFLVKQIIKALKQTFHNSLNDEYSEYLAYFIPFATAALFVCHPIQTQAVTYIVQRYASLATLLYLGSLLSYLLARFSFTNESEKFQLWLWCFASFFLAILAMKSKQIAFTLPIMVLMFELLLFRGKLLKNLFFLALIAALLLIIPLQIFCAHFFSQTSETSLNLLSQIQMATAETQNISRTDYFITQFRVVATYLRLLIVPINQNLDYDYHVSSSLLEPSVFAALLLHISILLIATALLIRSQRDFSSTSPTAGIPKRLACLGILWFYLALCVESSFIPIRDVIFEHRIYLSSTGFFIAMTAYFAGVAAHRKQSRNLLWAVLTVICLVLTASTIARNRIWSDETIMWQDVLKKSPNKSKVRYFAGFLYFKKFMPEKAVPHLVRAIELNPLTPYWITLNSQISILNQYKGRCSDGMKYHSSINTVDPRYRRLWQANSYNNLGLAYEYLGNIYLARESYLKALKLNPNFDFALNNLALLSAQ